MIDNKISESLPKNYLGFFKDNGDPDDEQMANFMELSRGQLADVFGLTVDQLRRPSLKTKEKLREMAFALEFVAETFEGDSKTTKFWIMTPNANFGGVSARQLILRGRYKKVVNFILSAKSNS